MNTFFKVGLCGLMMASTAWSQNLLVNGDFEAEPPLDGWLISSNAVAFGGLAPNSTRAVVLEGSGQYLGQNPPYAAPDWYVDFYFAVRDAGANRAFSLLVNQAADGDNVSAATINLRYQSSQFNTYASGSWGTDLGLGTIQFSKDANADGDLNDAGDIKNVYRMRVTGHSWGMPTANYDIELSEVNSTNLTKRVNGLTRYQSGSGVNGPPQSFVFNTAFGSNPGFWVDDVEFGVIELPDDPNLEVVLDGELFGRLPVDSGTVQRSLTVQNSGASADLVITNGLITGADASKYILQTAFPIVIPVGATANIDISFEPGQTSGSFGASLALVSNDPSTPEFSVNLSSVRLLTGAQLLQNPTFEATPFSTGWLTATGVDQVPGLVAGSASAAWLSTNGLRLGQNVTCSPDWNTEFYCAIPDVGDSIADAFGFYVTTVGDIFNAGEIKLRLTYVTNAWVILGAERPELGTLLPSADANGDGDLNDPGDTKNVYRIRIIGHAWDTDTATVDVEVSDANKTELNRGVYGLPVTTRSAVPYGFAFTSANNSNPGFWVDDVRLFVGVPQLAISQFSIGGGKFRMRWNSEQDATYFIDTSANLAGGWQLGAFGPVPSEGTNTGYTNSTTGDRLFFRVRKQ
jgi:hypothetical protein